MNLKVCLLVALLALGACASSEPHKPVPHPDRRSVAPVSSVNSCERKQSSCMRCHEFSGFEDLKRDADKVAKDMDTPDFHRWNDGVMRAGPCAPDFSHPASPTKSNAKLY